ncbi:MAG: hypothetical protein WBW81_10205 [Methylocella sp.]
MATTVPAQRWRQAPGASVWNPPDLSAFPIKQQIISGPLSQKAGQPVRSKPVQTQKEKPAIYNLLSQASFTGLHHGLTGKLAAAGVPNKTPPSFPRRLASGLVATQLLLGTATVSALASAAPAGATTVLGPHDDCQGVATATIMRPHGVWQVS